jgi:hypothetical protein
VRRRVSEINLTFGDPRLIENARPKRYIIHADRIAPPCTKLVWNAIELCTVCETVRVAASLRPLRSEAFDLLKHALARPGMVIRDCELASSRNGALKKSFVAALVDEITEALAPLRPIVRVGPDQWIVPLPELPGPTKIERPTRQKATNGTGHRESA